jgi:hypothetical protein
MLRKFDLQQLRVLSPTCDVKMVVLPLRYRTGEARPQALHVLVPKMKRVARIDSRLCL